ncbi:MAG: tripartite tricarboxylate transporter permease, partial [Rhodospirillales bacterium]
ALVLGKPLEEHLRVALTASQGDVSIFFTSGFSLLFLGLSALSIAWSFRAARKKPAAQAGGA